MKHTSCDVGELVKPDCIDCPHKIAYQKASDSKDVVVSYRLGLLHALLNTNLYKSRRLFVFDECHTLETHLTEFQSIVVSEKSCKKFGCHFKAPKTMYEAKWFLASTYVPAVEEYITHMRPHIDQFHIIAERNPSALSKDDLNAMVEFDETIKHGELIKELVCKDDFMMEKEYALILDKSFFKFKELYGKSIFKNLLDRQAEKMVFMSSTVLDKKAFCDDLGIDENQTAFISVQSEFEQSNRPVFFMPKAKMSYGWDSPERAHDRKSMIDAIKMLLCETHDNDNGIIHTSSFQISIWLVKEVSKFNSHKVYHHNPDGEHNRDIAIDLFLNEKTDRPKVLISPSITEGLDLVGDLGRFAIFAKVPFPHLGDAWVKARQTLSQNWYNRQAAIAIIQGGGRIVRSETDWGNTYILDSTFDYLYSKSKSVFPKWWKDAYEVI